MDSAAKKICMLGEFAVGKTSLVQRFMHNRFSASYASTMGVKVSHKTVVVPGDGSGLPPLELSVVVWDLAGGEDHQVLRASYLRATAGAALVCDLTRKNTFHRLEHYVDELSQMDLHIPMVLMANKCDLVEQQEVELAEVEALALRLGVPHYLTSAKAATNVHEAFRHLAQMTNLVPVER